MRLFLTMMLLFWVGSAAAKEKAAFLKGQYATKQQCEKLRKIEAGGPRNVETAPELLDATGFMGWEGGCEFTKIFEHEPGKSWLALAVCFEGPQINPATFVIMKNDDDTFEVSAENQGETELYVRCDAKKGN